MSNKLGKYIELCDEKNKNLIFDIECVRGISTQKQFMPTKADMDGVSLKNYKVVRPNCFAYVPDTSRRGDKISLAYNDSDDSYLVSSISLVFKVISDELNPEFLFLYFNRPEFDRYARYNSWGSAREPFSWNDMCDIEIKLPPISVQNKYVNIYNALKNNYDCYSNGIDDLKLVCDGFIENLKKTYKSEQIGKYLKRGSKNTDEKITNVLGIGQDGFMKPQKDPNASLRNYKILERGVICYAPPLYNIMTGAIHLYLYDFKSVCSPIYETFYCQDSKLLPEYLILWLKREEFKRYAEFYAMGVRNTFDYNLMEEVEIPIPSIEIQQSIANIFNCYLQRIEINNELRNNLKSLCSILINGALKEKI